MKVRLVVERGATPHNARPIKDRRGGPEDVPTSEQPAIGKALGRERLCSGTAGHATRPGSQKPVRSYDRHVGYSSATPTIFSRHSGKSQSSAGYHLAVLALWRNLPERDIVSSRLRGRRFHCCGFGSADLWPHTPARYSSVRSRAAIVDDRVVPVSVGLGKHTLDALAKIGFAVVDRRNHTDEGVHGQASSISHDVARDKSLLARSLCRFHPLEPDLAPIRDKYSLGKRVGYCYGCPLQTTPSRMMQLPLILSILPVLSSIILSTLLRTRWTLLQYGSISSSYHRPRFFCPALMVSMISFLERT